MDQWHNTINPLFLSLDGEWDFTLDGQTGMIRTPGTWEAQGYARRVEGPAVYRRTVAIPAAWQGMRVQLQFDAVSYHVEAHVNGMSVGEHIGMWSAFAFDITDSIRCGEDNTLELTIFKPGERFPMRESLAGFLPDVSIPFGGIWQQARLVAYPGAAISNLWLLPNVESGIVRVEARLHQASGMTASVRLLDPSGQEVATWQNVVDADQLRAELLVETPRLWQPDDPAMYTVENSLEADGVEQARIERRFGFRKLMHHGDQLLFNGAPVVLRGVLNWGWYPDILCPAPDEVTIREEFRRVRALGYNLVKLCLYVPSPLYFEIADEEGMLLWLELPMWLPDVTPRLEAQAPVEYAEILAQVHHHPSIVIYSLGCELDAAVDADLLRHLDVIVRSRTSGVLACDNSGSGEAYGGLTFDYADFNDYHFYCDLHYFTPLVDHFSRDWRPPRPWIFGEFCDADDYRDLDEIAAAFGGALPWYLTDKNPIHPLEKLAYPEQAARMAKLADLGFSGQDLQRISREQSFLIRKTILEKVRGRAGMGGYVVTGLRDTPLATSSMFDDFGRSKYDADAFRVFNADSVLVLEQGRRRIWQRGGDRPTPVDRFNLWANAPVDYRIVLAHTGAPLPDGELVWHLLAMQGGSAASGRSRVRASKVNGAPREIASIAFVTPPDSGQFTLWVDLADLHNDWTLWIYPAPAPLPTLAWHDPGGALSDMASLKAGALDVSHARDFDSVGERVLITSAPNDAVMAFVRDGGRALILQQGAGGLPALARPFWRESIKLIYDHPVWDGFPHQGYADLQFYHLATDFALNTDQLRASMPDLAAVTPILRRLDVRLFTLADYLVELHIGSGVALASTLRFAGGLGDQVHGLDANVAGRYLIGQMLQYLAGA